MIMNASATMKLIIVGAGISGLTLAAALAQLAPRIEVELYERDAAADARRRGYAIGLKGDAGLIVLERLGLLVDVLSIGAEQVTNFVITDRQGRTLLALPSGNDARHQTYRVQRDHLQSADHDTGALWIPSPRLRDDRHAAPGGLHRRPSCGRRCGGWL